MIYTLIINIIDNYISPTPSFWLYWLVNSSGILVVLSLAPPVKFFQVLSASTFSVMEGGTWYMTTLFVGALFIAMRRIDTMGRAVEDHLVPFGSIGSHMSDPLVHSVLGFGRSI